MLTGSSERPMECGGNDVAGARTFLVPPQGGTLGGSHSNRAFRPTRFFIPHTRRQRRKLRDGNTR